MAGSIIITSEIIKLEEHKKQKSCIEEFVNYLPKLVQKYL